MWDSLVFTQYSYYCDFLCSGPASRLCYFHLHVWARYIDTTKITVACMSLLLFYIDLGQLCYFIMFYYKLTNDDTVKWWMVKWCNGEIKIRIGRFSPQILNLFIFLFFEHSIFSADKTIHNFKIMITNNKYSNKGYVIKIINHCKTGLYQGSAGCCDRDRDSDINIMDS